MLDRFLDVVRATLFVDTVHTRDELLEIVARNPRRIAPGQQYRYSNGNYIVLGAVLERATGRSVTELLREHVLQPVGASDTRLLGAGPAACRRRRTVSTAKSQWGGGSSVSAWGDGTTLATLSAA